MFLSALQTPLVVALIFIILAQYGFAVFCLLKLAYLDITKREYTLWNVFILLVFFIGGAVFLVYWNKHKDKRIQPYVSPENKQEEKADTSEQTDATEQSDGQDAGDDVAIVNDEPSNEPAPEPEEKTQAGEDDKPNE